MARPSGDHTPLGGFRFQGQRMIADRDDHTSTDLDPQPAWAGAWHLWTAVAETSRTVIARTAFSMRA